VGVAGGGEAINRRGRDILKHAISLRGCIGSSTGDTDIDVVMVVAFERYVPSHEGKSRFDPKAEPFAAFMELLNWVITKAESLSKVAPGPARANEMLVTVALTKHYEKHFERKAGRSKSADGGKIGGPFLRFVQATYRELGRPVPTENSIETYIKRARRNGGGH
jgi:hypothetical protein